MASYEETLVNITLDAHDDIVVDTRPPIREGTAPAGASDTAGFQYRFVSVSGPHQCNLFDGTTTGSIPVGVLQSKPQVSEMAATVAIAGISLVEAGGVVAAGAVVDADATGRAVAGADVGLGVAIHGADAAGELIPVLLRLTTAAVPA